MEWGGVNGWGNEDEWRNRGLGDRTIERVWESEGKRDRRNGREENRS